LLTLFRPATGEARAKGVRSVTNAVLHSWLQEQLLAVLEAQEKAKGQASEGEPTPPPKSPEQAQAHAWETRVGWRLSDRYPPLRMVLVWDNLAGHPSRAMRRWLFAHGIMPLSTPLVFVVVEYGRVDAAHPGAAGSCRARPAHSAADHRLVGTDGGRL